MARGTLTNDDIDVNTCDTEVSMVVNNIASLYAAFREGPIHVNVHTIFHPGGEVRDQLFVNR